MIQAKIVTELVNYGARHCPWVAVVAVQTHNEIISGELAKACVRKGSVAHEVWEDDVVKVACSDGREVGALVLVELRPQAVGDLAICIDYQIPANKQSSLTNVLDDIDPAY